MKIGEINVYRHQFTLARPYTIAYKTQDSAENIIVEMITDSGEIGFGAASPAVEVTGETMDACLHALSQERLDWCYGKKIEDFPLLRQLCYETLKKTPAASAAIDMALHDLYAKKQGQPLVEVLGKVHTQMATSITIGIKNIEETLIEAKEYFERGFRVLKVKLGTSLEEDIARLIALREKYGSEIVMRVDPNQGYSFSQLQRFINKTSQLDIEFIEQPLNAKNAQELLALTDEDKKRIALDESVLNANDALLALVPTPKCGIFNIKLMKCGGIFAAQKIATMAEAAKLDLMWGCMDESIISISAALHAAFASKATKYIDLDGSLDLINDVVSGGFTLKEGIMKPLPLAGLGVKKI